MYLYIMCVVLSLEGPGVLELPNLKTSKILSKHDIGQWEYNTQIVLT